MFSPISGYYCTSGVDRPDPNLGNDTSSLCPTTALHTGLGGVCPLGHYCPVGSERPLACNAGTYAESIGMFECSICPAGYYCLDNSTEFLSMECPVGEFCFVLLF